MMNPGESPLLLGIESGERSRPRGLEEMLESSIRSVTSERGETDEIIIATMSSTLILGSREPLGLVPSVANWLG